MLVKPTPGPFFIILIIYFLILASIGWYATRRTKTLGDFLTMSGKAGAMITGFAYFSSQYSMSTFMGVPAVTYTTGFSGMSISVPGLAFSMIIPALFIGRKLIFMGHKYKFLTMSDYLADRYESNNIRAIHAVMIFVFLIAMIGAQTVGAGIILNAFTGLPEWVGVVGMGIVVVLYCMSGGMQGAMMTDVLQGLLMLLTAVVAFLISINAGGGIESIIEGLQNKDPSYLTHPGVKSNFGWATYASMIVMWSFFTIGQPTLFTKFFAMKNYKTLFKSVLLGTLGMLISATLIEWAGVNAILTVPNLTGKDTQFIVPLLLQQHLHPIIASLLITGIMSAGMSTIDALLVVATGAITRDLYQNIINPKATTKQIFRLSRLVTVMIGAIGVIIGIMKPTSIFELVKFAFGGLGIWVAPVILGLYWKRATTKGAIISVMAGEFVYITMKMNLISITFGFDPLIISWLMTMIFMVITSLLTKSNSPVVIKRHFDDLEIRTR